MTLPNRVIEKDRTLRRSADELMKLRWHWTLDETNGKRVGFSEYARQVGTDEARIRGDAKAWGKYQQMKDSAPGGLIACPGAPQTPDDFREMEKLSEERQLAARAVARNTGKSVGNVAKHKKEEVSAVVNTARERAADRGTTVEHEIERAADWRAKAANAAQREKDERRRRSTAAFIKIEGDIGAAIQRLRKVLTAAEDVDFSDEESELIAAALGKLRALLNLIDLRIAGETDIDWDAEFEKLTS
jgi:hypothetical protein